MKKKKKIATSSYYSSVRGPWAKHAKMLAIPSNYFAVSQSGFSKLCCGLKDQNIYLSFYRNTEFASKITQKRSPLGFSGYIHTQY